MPETETELKCRKKCKKKCKKQCKKRCKESDSVIFWQLFDKAFNIKPKP